MVTMTSKEEAVCPSTPSVVHSEFIEMKCINPIHTVPIYTVFL
jgi:hypothetical protein